MYGAGINLHSLHLYVSDSSLPEATDLDFFRLLEYKPFSLSQSNMEFFLRPDS